MTVQEVYNAIKSYLQVFFPDGERPTFNGYVGRTRYILDNGLEGEEEWKDFDWSDITSMRERKRIELRRRWDGAEYIPKNGISSSLDFLEKEMQYSFMYPNTALNPWKGIGDLIREGYLLEICPDPMDGGKTIYCTAYHIHKNTLLIQF